MYGKGFLGNMTENLQADCVQSRQAGFMQCFLCAILPVYNESAAVKMPAPVSAAAIGIHW